MTSTTAETTLIPTAAKTATTTRQTKSTMDVTTTATTSTSVSTKTTTASNNRLDKPLVGWPRHAHTRTRETLVHSTEMTIDTRKKPRARGSRPRVMNAGGTCRESSADRGCPPRVCFSFRCFEFPCGCWFACWFRFAPVRCVWQLSVKNKDNPLIVHNPPPLSPER